MKTDRKVVEYCGMTAQSVAHGMVTFMPILESSENKKKKELGRIDCPSSFYIFIIKLSVRKSVRKFARFLCLFYFIFDCFTSKTKKQ